MQEPISVLEHKKHPEKGCKCEIEDLVGLESYLEKNDLSSCLHVTASGIKTTSWVGVVKYKKQQIQILPKLLKSDKLSENNIQTILQNLIFMLSYTKKLEIKTNNIANLSKCQNPFLEILIREFCNSLFDALKRLSPKNYIREEENLNFLRGKLKFNENIKYNCANQAKFYCEFDEFSENNLLNQLFLYVSTALYKISQNSKNKTVLKQIIDYFSEIKIRKFDKYNICKIRLTRNQSLFKKPFELAKLFVEHSSIDISSNKFENITLLWDMNKLFEEFVYEILRQNTDLNITAQKGRRLLRGVDDGETRRDTKIDIFVEVKGEKIIIDTKYKEFKSLGDVKSADIYQVVTYCRLHHSDKSKVKKAFLIYPRYNDEQDREYYLNIHGTDEQDLKTYLEYLDENSIKLRFIDIDITQTLNKEKVKQIAKELEEKIKMKIEFILGDITTLEVDMVTNAANTSLLGGGGVDGAIHRVAGTELLEECKTLGGCETGQTKVTGAYNLPAKYIAHTVGPVWNGGNNNEYELLKSCYQTTLDLAKKYKVKSIAFPSISCGVYKFPKEEACKIALQTVVDYINQNDCFDRIVFIDINEDIINIYKELWDKL